MDISALDAAEYEDGEAEIHVFTKDKESAKCSECRWSRKGHKPRCSKESRIQTTTEEPTTSWDQGSHAIQGMSFDEAKVFFHDMHNVENKGKAKVL